MEQPKNIQVKKKKLLFSEEITFQGMMEGYRRTQDALGVNIRNKECQKTQIQKQKSA